MSRIGKICFCLLMFTICSYSISAMYSSTVVADYQASQPVNSFFVLTSGIDFIAYEGVPFKIFIFAYDSEGHQTFNTYGNISLSVQSGTITPSTFGPPHEGLYAPRVTITGTDLAVITVSDSQGHTGKATIPIVSPTTSSLIPSPTESPTPPPYPSVPELSWWVIVPLLVSVLLSAVIIKHRKKHCLSGQTCHKQKTNLSRRQNLD